MSATGVQWILNGYLLALAALFAFGGRLADIAGHRRMVVIGVITFATASALCGATPTGSDASRIVFLAMAAVIAVAFVVALVKVPSGKVEEEIAEPAPPASGPA